MSTAEIVVRCADTYAVGAAIAAGISLGIEPLFPSAAIPILIVLLVVWLYGTLAGFTRWRGRTTETEIIHPQSSTEKLLLPFDFRFIGPNTTLQDILDRLGPYNRVRDAIDGRNLQWDVPYGTVCIFFDGPVEKNSFVGRIRYLKTKTK